MRYMKKKNKENKENKEPKRRNGYALAAKLMRSNIIDKRKGYNRKKEKRVEQD